MADAERGAVLVSSAGAWTTAINQHCASVPFAHTPCACICAERETSNLRAPGLQPAIAESQLNHDCRRSGPDSFFGAAAGGGMADGAGKNENT